MKKIVKLIIASTLLVSVLGMFSFKEELENEVKGWFKAGNSPDSYEIGIETDAARGGKVAYMKSIKPKIKGFGSLMQQFIPSEYLGKRVRLSGYLKTKDVLGWSGMWMRIDGEAVQGKSPKMLGFDNMNDRRIVGTTDWKQYEIVLDVPSDSKLIAYGILTSGTGLIWMDDLKFEIIDKNIPTTSGSKYNLDKPTNTSFEDEN